MISTWSYRQYIWYQVGKLVHGHGVAKDVCVLIVVVNVVLVGLPSDATQELFLVWWILFSVILQSKDSVNHMVEGRELN